MRITKVYVHRANNLLSVKGKQRKKRVVSITIEDGLKPEATSITDASNCCSEFSGDKMFASIKFSSKRPLGAEDQTEDEFQLPKKTARQPERTNRTTTKTTNRFSNLSENIMDNDIDVKQDAGKKVKPPPPIILHQIPKNTKDFAMDIKKNVTGKFHIKHARNTTRIQFETRDDRSKVIEGLKNQNVQFHTFTDKPEKTHGFVIRGLQLDTDTQDILADVTAEGVPAQRCYRMNTKQVPMFLLITDSSVTLKSLNNTVKFIQYCKVKFERHRNHKQIIQCHKCQAWGHAQSNCFAKAVCHKCAGEHHYSQCTKSRDQPAKCCNCQQDHPASSTECPAYKKALHAAQSTRTTSEKSAPPQQQQYVPAPAPTVNFWEARAATAAVTTTQQQPLPTPVKPKLTQVSKPSVPSTKTNTTSQSLCHSQTDPPLDFNELDAIRTELNKLNNLCNLSKLLEGLKFLNSLLEKASNPYDKIIALDKFNKYAISNGL